MQRTRLQVPEENGAVFAHPPLDSWPELVRQNRLTESRRCVAAPGIGPNALSELRVLARDESLNAALAHTRCMEMEFDSLVGSMALPTQTLPRNPASIGSTPLIVTGHQPELFHPGVWVKNFAADWLARQTGGIALNVIVANDVVKQTAIAVPAGGPRSPMLAFVPFDRQGPKVPFEERAVLDEKVFGQFVGRIEEHLCAFPFRSLTAEFGKQLEKSKRWTGNLGERLAFARRGLERTMGRRNLEIPLSVLCHTSAYRQLANHLLGSARAFAAIHNECLSDYRRRYHVTSRHHPVPALEADGDWHEAPFWAWSQSEPRRQRVFVRPAGTHLVLRIGTGEFRIESVAELTRWKLRPRALVTTMFLRWLVADFFIHGIGGGKYDELGDEIFRRFLDVDPPTFGILSATLRLPVADSTRNDGELYRAERQRRDLHWNPDRYLDECLREQESIARLIERKFALMEETSLSAEQRRVRFHEFRALNDRLREYLGDQPGRAAEECDRLHDKRRVATMLGSREFAFFLYPREAVADLMERPFEAATRILGKSQ